MTIGQCMHASFSTFNCFSRYGRLGPVEIRTSQGVMIMVGLVSATDSRSLSLPGFQLVQVIPVRHPGHLVKAVGRVSV